MLEKQKLSFHLGMVLGYAKNIVDLAEKGDIKRLMKSYGGLRTHAEKYQELHKKLHGAEDPKCAQVYEQAELMVKRTSGEISDRQFVFRAGLLRDKYKPESEKKEEETRRDVRKEFLELGSQLGVVGQDPDEFVSDRMIDMYRIARDRLGDNESILRMIYVDNPQCPAPVREIIGRYVKKEISKEEAAKQLTERQEAAKKVLGKMKINAKGSKDSFAVVSPSVPYMVSVTDRAPKMVFHRQLTPTDSLMAGLLADSMDETGEVDKRKLFMNVAEISLYNEWAKLMEKIGDRDPTPEEIIDAMTKSYEITYEAKTVPDAFKDEKDFRNWMNNLSSGLRENKDIMYEKALPAYRSAKEIASKKDHEPL